MICGDIGIDGVQLLGNIKDILQCSPNGVIFKVGVFSGENIVDKIS